MTKSIESIYWMIFERHPNDYENEIGKYIKEYEKTYERYRNLISIEILIIFRKYRRDTDFFERFKDVYEVYDGTEFMLKRLSDEARFSIAQRYIDEMWNYRKEFCHAIQK